MSTRWDAGHYRDRHAFVFESSRDLVSGWLEPQPGERILDLGCGSGELSAQIAAAGAGVLGVDASEAMIAAARERHAGLFDTGLTFEVRDAHRLTFQQDFDAVFSNAALHWMKPLPEVFARVRAALKPGGRFVFESGGAGNVQTIVDAVERGLEVLSLPGLGHPWTFPPTPVMAALLEEAGLRVERLHWFARPSPLPAEDGLRAWLTGFASGWLAPLSASQREAVLEEAERRARPRLWDGEAGLWRADYCRLRGLARRV